MNSDRRIVVKQLDNIPFVAHVEQRPDSTHTWDSADVSTVALFHVNSSDEVRATDLAIVQEIFLEDVYDTRGHDFTDKVVVDIGAHIGVFSISAALTGAVVYAYEADAFNVRMTHRNAVFNNVANKISVTHAAVVGDASNSVEYQRDKSGVSNVVKSDTANVPSLTLEQILTEVRNASKSVYFLKMDIEGTEYEIFEHIIESLVDVDHIAMEFHAAENIVELSTLLTNLLETHRLSVFGKPTVGGMIHATRYGASG